MSGKRTKQLREVFEVKYQMVAFRGTKEYKKLWRNFKKLHERVK